MQSFKKKKTKMLAKIAANRQVVDKDRIAQIVHDAVCEFTDSDGYGRCAYYTIGACVLARLVTGQEYLPQAGNLYLQGDPDRPECTAFLVSDGGLHGGAFHSWAMGPIPPGQRDGVMPDSVFYVDLSARHYRRYVDTAPLFYDEGCSRLTWRREDPPAYLWCKQSELPAWVRLVGDQEATMQLYHALPNFTDFKHYLLRRWKGLPAIEFIRM